MPYFDTGYFGRPYWVEGYFDGFLVVGDQLYPMHFASDDQVFDVNVFSLSQLEAQIYDDTETFYVHAIGFAGGDQELVPAIYADADAIYIPVASTGLGLRRMVNINVPFHGRIESD